MLPNQPAVDVQESKKPELPPEINDSLKTGEVLIHLSDPDADPDAAISPHGADLAEALRERNSETRFIPAGGTELADLLGRPVGEQVIPHALDVRTDADAVNNFTPARLAEMTVPADPTDGGLGVFDRLRIARVVNQTMAAKLSARGGPPDLDALRTAAACEQARLARRREEVRSALRKQLAAEIARIEQKVADLRANNVSEAAITADHDRRKLFDLKHHLARLTGCQ